MTNVVLRRSVVTRDRCETLPNTAKLMHAILSKSNFASLVRAGAYCRAHLTTEVDELLDAFTTNPITF